jgi:hypothetical protein
MSIFDKIGKFFDRAIIHPVETFVQHAFTLPGQPAQAPVAAPVAAPAPDPLISALKASVDTQTQAITAQTAFAQQQASDALAASKKATSDAAAAAVPTVDSESARAAQDDLLRKRALGSGYGVGMAKTFGAPPVGFRELSGS